MKIINLPAAAREFAKIVAHYYKERPRRASAFVEELDRVSALLCDNPNLGTPEEGEVRGYVLGRFPYIIYYVTRPDLILVVAISHQSRRPGYWRKRLRGVSES